MSLTVVLTKAIFEHQTGVYSFILVNEDGDGIDGAQLNTLTLTYTDAATGLPINGRDGQDVFNMNNVSLATLSVPSLVTTITWDIRPEDTVIVTPTRAVEQHLALFQWTWAAGQKHQAHKVQFGVEALRYVLADL